MKEIRIRRGEEKEIREFPNKESKIRLILEENSKVVYRELSEGNIESNVEIVHEGRNSISRVIIGSIIRNGFSKTRTIIRILEQAEGSDAKLEQKCLIIGKGHIEQKPELDVRNRNVKAGHAASIERPGEEELFYLRSRGINNPEDLIIESFKTQIMEGDF